MNGLIEILTNKVWMIMPEYIHGSRTLWERNLNGHIALALDAKKAPFGMALAQEGTTPIRSYQVTEDGKAKSRWYMDEMETPFVNIMPVDGPITRDGGACSYGSMELRDWLMRAANYDLCKAHVFVINSPGGSAWAINDFKQAIDYAHARQQKVYAFIDGYCASAAIYLASQCDEVYYMHPKDQIGSVGVLAAFYTEKNGSYNQFSNETYHELYDPESFDKNAWHRDIAENPKNDKKLMAELIQTGIEFRADIQKAFPAATKKHIHGALFDAEKVKGIFCDGQMSLDEVVLRAFAVANGTAQPVERIAPPAGTADPDEDNDNGEETTASNVHGSTQNSTNMNKNYENIATACGVSELVTTDEGAHFVPAMLDALDQSLAQAAEEKKTAQTTIEGLQNQLNQAQKDLTEAVANKETELNEAHAIAISNLCGEHDTALANAQKEKEDLEAQLKKAQEELATAQQAIKDRDDQIATLTKKPTEEHDLGPTSNGTGTNPEEEHGMPAYDANLSPMENKRILDEYRASLHK